MYNVHFGFLFLLFITHPFAMCQNVCVDLFSLSEVTRKLAARADNKNLDYILSADSADALRLKLP